MGGHRSNLRIWCGNYKCSNLDKSIHVNTIDCVYMWLEMHRLTIFSERHQI